MEKLIDTLIKEIEIYKEESNLVKKKIEAIQRDDIQTIEAITKQEEVLLEDIEFLESERNRQISELGYNTLIEYADSIEVAAEKEKILEIRKELLSVLDEIRFQNKTAEQLVNISAGIINNVIKSVTGNKEIGYRKDSKKKEVTQNNLLNTKI